MTERNKIQRRYIEETTTNPTGKKRTPKEKINTKIGEK